MKALVVNRDIIQGDGMCCLFEFQFPLWPSEKFATKLHFQFPLVFHIVGPSESGFLL